MRTDAQRAARRRRRTNAAARRASARAAPPVDAIPLCPCGAPATLVTGAVLWPHRPHLADALVWTHEPCDTRVGTHPGTTRALGALADEPTRRARQRAHAVFDPIWRAMLERRPDWQRHKARHRAYRWLAARMELHIDATHIAHFDVQQCEQVIEACEERAAAELDSRGEMA